MNYTEIFDFDYEDHDFIESQQLLGDLVDGGEITRSEAQRFCGRTLWAGTALGLSTSHIFAPHHDKIRPKAVFWKGAELISCKRLGVRIGEQGNRDSKRGKITEFSRKSRRRLMQTVAKVRNTELPMFITLTYPGEFSLDPKQWKKDLKNFCERMSRAFDEIAILWRLEPQKRGAPHYHLLVWGLDARYKGTSYGELISWVSRNWYEVVGSEDERHLRAGTRVERVKSRNGVMFYASKYLSKVDLEPWKDLDVGRFWGIYFRCHMPWGEYVEVILSDQEAVELIRTMRKKIKKRRYSGRSLSIFGNADFWFEKLPDILYPLGVLDVIGTQKMTRTPNLFIQKAQEAI